MEEISNSHVNPHSRCDENSDSSDNQRVSCHPYAEFKKETTDNEFGNKILKRNQNAVFKRIRDFRKVNNDQAHLENKAKNISLLGRRRQQEISPYTYYHRRFCYASSKALFLLHTVRDIKKIIIPDRVPLCEVCAARKIKKKQSKRLAEHAPEPLALVSFDIAGSFPVSYRGYRYFGELVDNWM